MQNNGYLWITLAVILALVELWAIRSIIASKGARSERKMLWIVLIVFVPLLGLIVWGVAGPKAINSPQANKG